MAKKKEPDKLALDMIQCKADGYGCHYGAWKATQDRPVAIEPKPDELPEGWLVCQHCGKPFKPKTRRPQKYCDAVCQREVQIAKNKARKAEWYRASQERKAEG